MSLAATYPYYLANKPVAPNHDLDVLDKYSGEVATRVAMADDAAIDRAIQAAVEATEPMARMAAYERQAVLDHCVLRFQERSARLLQLQCARFHRRSDSRLDGRGVFSVSSLVP
mgnify:CR=1 FL=1